MKELSQKQMVLAHLQRFGVIDPMTAIREYGCYRLSAVIYDLRDDGYSITTRKSEEYSKITGRKVQYAQYWLDDLQPEKSVG